MILIRSVLVFVVLLACSIRQSEGSSASDRNLCRDASVPGERGIVIGREVAPGDKWPWLVALIVKSDNKFFCGGSLISDQFVLTAAHCIQSKGDKQPRDPKDVNIYLGKWNLSDATEQDAVLATPMEFRVHADWNVTDTRWDADIAIVRLADNVTFSRSVQPVCLWTSQMQPDEANDGGIVVGWGKTEVNGEYSDIPEETKVLRLPIEDCYETDGLSQFISRRGLCLRGSREGACRGDDGGGFFTAQGGKWFLRGITSVSRHNTAMECDAHAIFTNVEKFVPWIDQVLDGDEEINCEFMYENDGYTCRFHNALTRSDTKIFQVRGSHLEGRSNEDVRRFGTWYKTELKFLPIAFGRFFPNLEEYAVRFSGIEQISRNIFADLPKLNAVWIDNCRLKVIPVDVFYDLTNLEVLMLQRNQIEAIDSDTFIYNTKLRQIALHHNKITSLDTSTFRNNLELFYIDLSKNLLTSIGPELLTPLEKLAVVYFDGNPCINKNRNKEELKEMFASKCQ